MFLCREQSRRLSDVAEGYEGELPPMEGLEGRLEDLLPPVFEDDASPGPHGSTVKSGRSMGMYCIPYP